MSDVLHSDKRRARSAPRAPKPTDGRCELCKTQVGRSQLKDHHCHDCGVYYAWLCNDCNLALTEHVLRRWDAVDAFVRAHECHPMLFVVGTGIRPTPISASAVARQHYLSNGGGDSRYISASTVKGYITIEQLAAVLGVNTGTTRQIVSGRHSGIQRGEKHDGTWLVAHDEVLAILRERWELE